jgi:DNA-directed RNA polymerases I and III subunit RPAC1
MPPKKENKFITSIKYPYQDSWDKTKTHVEFDLENVHHSLANAIRRCIISKVPTVGFRTEPYQKCQVKVLVNDSPLHNQFLTHRIAMLPINYKRVEKYDEDEFQYEINEFNDTNVIKDITTEHIKVKKLATNKYLSYDEVKHLFPPDPLTGDYPIITKLRPKYYTPLKLNTEVMNQINSNYEKKTNETVKLHVEARACVSNGSENGHFEPSARSNYINKVDEEKARIAEEKYVLQEQEKEKLHELTPSPREKLIQKFRICEKYRYFHVNDKDEPNKFTFFIESVGVIPPLVIFHQAIKIVIDKINLFVSNLINKNKSVIEIKPSVQLNNGYDILVLNEDHTLGYLLQNYLSMLYADYTLPEKERTLKHIGYKQPHPLDNYIKFTIQGKNDSIDKLIETAIVPGCNNILKVLNRISAELENTKQFTDEMKIISSALF